MKFYRWNIYRAKKWRKRERNSLTWHPNVNSNIIRKRKKIPKGKKRPNEMRQKTNHIDENARIEMSIYLVYFLFIQIICLGLVPQVNVCVCVLFSSFFCSAFVLAHARNVCRLGNFQAPDKISDYCGYSFI